MHAAPAISDVAEPVDIRAVVPAVTIIDRDLLTTGAHGATEPGRSPGAARVSTPPSSGDSAPDAANTATEGVDNPTVSHKSSPTTTAFDVTSGATVDGVADADTVVVGVFRGGFTPPGTEEVLAAAGLDATADLRTADFRAHVGEALLLATTTGPWRRLVVTGLGQMSDLAPEVLRRAAGAAGREVGHLATHVVTTLAQVDPSDAHARAVIEGFLLGIHRDERFRTSPEPTTVQHLSLAVSGGRVEPLAELVPTARRHARAQLVARELVTTPAGHLGPEEVAAWAVAALGDHLEVEVLDTDDLVERGCGGLLAVAAGSARPPRLVRIHHRPEHPVASLALVGKGITFDSGGLSLKSPAGQAVMKKDMGGAAVILGVMSALVDQDLPIAVTAHLALAENMPSGDATRPGDVITIADGTTVTVANTDAEGRLVLADALAMAAADGVDAIIDVATLTGAVQHAIGKRAFGVFGNDDDLLDRVLTAAAAAGESAWHLPLWDDVDSELEDDVADVVNVVWPPDRERGGATVAGLFLRRFVHGVPWVHLDIAGASWATEARGHLPEHATGVGVRTLLHLLEATHTPT